MLAFRVWAFGVDLIVACFVGFCWIYMIYRLLCFVGGLYGALYNFVFGFR